jgi:hypothetical protein
LGECKSQHSFEIRSSLCPDMIGKASWPRGAPISG